MAKVLIHDENLTNIANAIREKNGETTTYLPSEMAAAISNMQGGDPELEASYLSTIDGSAGANVTKLPEGLTMLGERAFQDRENLVLTELPEGITSILGYAFYGCKKLALTKLPSSLTFLQVSAFRGCTNLALTELPEKLTDIRSYAFHSCSNLALTKLPEKLTLIPDYCFYNCAKLALTRLPDGITNISTYSFYGCSNLALTELPSGVTYIGANIFSNCTSLPSMTCLGNVTYIGSNTFIGCSNLSYFALPNVTAVPSLSNSVFVRTPIANGTGYIYVPDTLVENFKAATEWCNYAEQIRPISSLNNILNLSQQQFPIITDGNLTVDYDATSQTFTLNGTVEESHGFNIPITQELLGTYTLSYNHTETDKAFYISIDNKTETMLNGWGANTKTFTLTEQPSQLMFWFDYSDSTPERNVYTDYKINLVLLEGESE